MGNSGITHSGEDELMTVSGVSLSWSRFITACISCFLSSDKRKKIYSKYQCLYIITVDEYIYMNHR